MTMVPLLLLLLFLLLPLAFGRRHRFLEAHAGTPKPLDRRVIARCVVCPVRRGVHASG